MKTTKCKYCGAPIVWVKTENGRDMPCEAEEVKYQHNRRGKSLIVTKDGKVIRGDVLKDSGKTPLVRVVDGIGWVSHKSACVARREQTNDSGRRRLPKE